MNVTEAKLKANQQNATRSTGPKQGKKYSRSNSYKHGFFAKFLRFATEEERDEYQLLEADLHRNCGPVGAIEELLVTRAATLLWNQRKIDALLQVQLDELTSPALEEQLKKFVQNSTLADTPILGLHATSSAARRGSPWEIRELLVRVGNEGSEEDIELSSTATRDKCYMEVRLGPSIDVLLRCRSTMERSLEKILNQLQKLQERRGQIPQQRQ